MTISEALGWKKTLQQRHAELVRLRDQNSSTRIMHYGENREEVKPEYDVKKLDRRITLLAREVRLCDEAIKKANAATVLEGFERRDEVLGELED